MQCNFQVGQKVVCIRAENAPMLELGRVYTVTWIDKAGPALSGLDGSVIIFGIRLQEVEPFPWDDGFDARRFRPVVETGTETGMSILRELLNNQDIPVEVVA